MSPDLIEQLQADLNRIASWRTVSDGVRVTTHVMYPSNGLVNVTIRGGYDQCIVTDEARGLGEGTAAGIRARPSDKRLSYLVRAQGLTISRGAIVSPAVPLSTVPVMILLVANASRDIALWLYDQADIKPHRDFRVALVDLLRTTFPERLHQGIVEGKRKSHPFANIVDLPTGDRLIVDAVAREPSSINARVVSNLDVAQAENPRVKQRMIYDDEEKWTPDDLGLLGMAGVPVIPFSRSPQIMHRIASNQPSELM